MFNNLISDPRVLFHGLLDSPETYENGVSELLQSLVSGQKKREDLSPEELQLLDRATLEFAAGKRPRPQQPAGGGEQTRAAPKVLSPPEEAELIYQEQGPPIPDMDIPEAAPTFWWRK